MSVVVSVKEVMIRLFLVFITLHSAASSSEAIGLQFLRGVRRLNTTDYIDLYFSCSVKGRFLRWKYKDDTLLVFQTSDNIGESVIRKRSNYEYIGTLLSSEPIGNDDRAMDSILIMSFGSSEHLSFEVTCSNGSHSETVHTGPVTDVTNSSAVIHDGNLEMILDYITSSPIVRDQQTHIFMCGTNHSTQQLQTNGIQIEFISADTLGTNRVASATTYAVNELGIYIAKDQFQIVSIIIVVQDNDVEVNCSYGMTKTKLCSNTRHAALRSTTTELVSQITTSATLASSAETETIFTPMFNNGTTPQHNTDENVSSNDDEKISMMIYIPVVFVVVLLVVVVIAIVVLAVYFQKRTQRRSRIHHINESHIGQENGITNEDEDSIAESSP